MANELTFDDVSTVLNDIVSQATGTQAIKATDTASFITIAQTALKMGYDQLNTAISQVLARTIFSARPYSEQFASLQVDNIAWGNHVRKLNFVDMPFEKDEAWDLKNGQSVDMYKVNAPKAIQTNFYGAETYYRSITRYGNQLNTAFRAPDELGRFWSALLVNIASQNKQADEAMRRACIANLIGGTIKAGNTNQVVHLLAEYNALTGLELTAQTVYQPENYTAFMRWVFGRVQSIRRALTQRTSLYHVNPTTASPVSGTIMRHTPYDAQRIYLLADIQDQISASVLADTYNDELITYQGVELVSFWQSPSDTDKIIVKPSYMQSDGTIKTEEEEVTQENIFGIIFDWEAAGVSKFNERFGSTPYNIKGDYFNYGWGWTSRWWNDNTENAIVLLLD